MVVIDVNVVETDRFFDIWRRLLQRSWAGRTDEYGERNFLGRGQALSFAVNTGANDRLYELSFLLCFFVMI